MCEIQICKKIPVKRYLILKISPQNITSAGIKTSASIQELNQAI